MVTACEEEGMGDGEEATGMGRDCIDGRLRWPGRRLLGEAAR